jgi:L-ascorbate metabolism protein UlaG (beta-lactamase superfamily)
LRERYDSFRIGLIPIGAYIPAFIMSHAHPSPSEAYRLAEELRVKTMIPIHYGIFRFADDCQDQPLMDLIEAILREENSVSVVVLENGQSARVSY